MRAKREAGCNWFWRRRAIAVFLVASLALHACTTWRPSQAPVAQVLETKPEARLRVTLSNSSVVDLRYTRISADSLYGRVGPRREAAIPLTDVRSVQVREFSRGRTTALVTTLVVFGGLVAWFGAACDDYCDR